MIELLSQEALSAIPALVLPEEFASPLGERHENGCQHCDAFRPSPQLSGNLQVDPEIHLPSPGMDVDIAYFYNAAATNSGPFGYGRTLSTNLTAQASGSPTVVTLTRGNGALVSFQDSGGTYVAKTPGVLNTLVKDVGNGLWKETTPDGHVTAYPLDTTGQISSLSYAEDAVGNRHSFSYSAGLLQTVQDSVGRFVSFSYSGGLLASIQDWAGRRTTFQYDTASASPKSLLTTVTGPTGCQTQYAYATFTLQGGTSDWLLAKITDPNGFATSYTYDQQRRVVTRSVAGAGVTTYLYQPDIMLTVDALGNVTTQSMGSHYSLAGSLSPSGGMSTFTRNGNLQETSRQNALGAVWSTSYDGSGNVIAQTDPLGNTTSLTRDGFNNITGIQTPDGAFVTNVWGYGGSPFDTTGTKRRLQAVVNQLGNRTSYTYNGRGQVASIQNALGSFTSFGYDSFGNRISTQDALGNVWTSTFDLAGNVTAQMNPLGNVWSATFDNQNRPLTQVDPLGNTSTVAYDSVGNRIVEINPLGFRTSYTFNVFDKMVSMQNPLGAVWTNLFDNLGRQTASVDPLGNRNTTVFDSSSRPIAQVNPLGFRTSAIFDIAGRMIATQDALGFYTTSVFDNADHRIATVDALGFRTSFNYDSNSRQISVQDALGRYSTTIFDAVGRGIASVDALGFRTSSVFDAANQAIASIDALGFRSSTVFDARGARIASQDALGRFTSTVFDNAGRAIAGVDALGNRSSTIYDAANRAIGRVDPLGRASTTIFDAASRVISSITPLGFANTVNYDAAGRSVSRQDARGNFSTTVYDAANRTSAVVSAPGYRTSFLYDSAGQQIAVQDALGFLHSSTFDGRGQQIATVDPLGFRTSSVFDALGQAVATVDALANRTSFAFDAIGQQITAQDARGYYTTFVFDLVGRQIALVDANSSRTSSLFNGRGDMLSSQDPLGAYTSYQFDAVGNTIFRTDARNQVTSYTLDVLYRTIGQVYPDGTRVTNTFDSAGQQTTQQDVTGIRSFSYDLDGRQTSVVYPSGQALTYSFDANANRTLLVDPDGGFTTYSWDIQNRLVGIVNPFAEYTTITWDALDRELRKTLANGLSVSHTYDAAGRETLLENRTAAGVALAAFTNSYDSIGNRLTVLELDGTRCTFGYDATYQLVNEQRSGSTPYNTTFVYDSVGNRLLKNDGGAPTTYTFNAANELVSSQITLSTMAYQVDSGGGSASGSFQADAFYSSPATLHTFTIPTAINMSGVTNPAPEAVYQTILYLDNSTTGPLNYTLTGLTPNADYRVRLHFATNVDGSAGQRAMSVFMNDQIVLSGLDVFAEAGGDKTALVKELVGTANGAGTLVVSLTGDPTKTWIAPFINGIEVLPWFYEINCGGSAAGSFQADAFTTDGVTYSDSHSIDTSGVTNPAPVAVYQALRYITTVGPITYTLPNLTPGASYRVRLHFSTPSDTGSGQREINVSLNGNSIVSGLDVWAAAGGAYIALVREATGVANGSGQIILAVTGNAGKPVIGPFINGIEVISAGLSQFVYDANGNLVSETAATGVTTFTWDTENRMLSTAEASNGVETYTYSADGMRQKKVTAAGTTNFVWDGQNVLQERDGTQARIAQYTDSPGQWGGLASQRQGATSSFYGFDSQSSSRILVSVGGFVTDYYSYKGFGEELAQGGGTVNPYRYVGLYGYYRDMVSRLYVRARHYGTSIGRWTTKDPLNMQEHPNSFVYVSDRVMTQIDPSGLIGIYPRTDFPPVAGPCGRATYSIRWSVSNNFSGLVIQHVVFESDIKDCAGNPIPEPKREYWERWIAVNGAVYAVSHRYGLFRARNADIFGLPGHPNTQGCQTVHGYARQYPSGALPGVHWIIPPGNPPLPSVDLPFWPVRPPGWTDTGGVAHWLKTCWNCCHGPTATCYYAIGPHSPPPPPPIYIGPLWPGLPGLPSGNPFAP